ncbi:hypothetical protein EV182_005269 [Spiromyces aspiralis]|uniref:Uncharacterized protein n=1 Tax=Spiromyces aspiralis TaxID=68401 RepID=A0ACC1HU53_9FUNG|nr:hypothetical protein EV182_005269 [Spiromyces aspiralis]
MPGVPRFTGTRIRQFLEDYEALATRMQYSDREKARRVVDYVVPELQDSIYYTIQYEDEDWPALRAHLIKRHDSPDRTRFRQELNELTSDKWSIKDIEKNTDRFVYLWHKAHGKAHDDETKSNRYLEALPDELVWAANNDIHDGTKLRAFEEIVEVVVVKVKQISNIWHTRKTPSDNVPLKDNTPKSTPFEAAPCPRNNMADVSPMAPALTDITILAEQFEKLALRVKELQANSTKVATTSKPCMYCDRQGHTKRQCELLTQDLRAKIVHINQYGKLTNLSGETYRLNTGNGGIRALITSATTKLVRSEPIQLATNATTTTIHWEEAPAAATHDKDTYTNEFEVNGTKRQAERQIPCPRKRIDEAEAQSLPITSTDTDQRHKTRILPRAWEEGANTTAVEKILSQTTEQVQDRAPRSIP